MIKLEGNFPEAIQAKATFNYAVDKTKTSQEVLQSFVNKAEKLFSVKDGWRYPYISDVLYKRDTDLLEIERGGEYISLKKNNRGKLTFSACVVSENAKKLERLFDRIKKLPYLKETSELEQTAPRKLISDSEVVRQIQLNDDNLKEFRNLVLEAVKENDTGSFVNMNRYAVYDAVEKKLKSDGSIYVKDAEEQMHKLIDYRLSELARNNKIYANNEEILYLNKENFADNEFNLTRNYCGKIITDIVFQNDYSTEQKVREGSEVWSVKDNEGKTLINLYVNNTSRTSHIYGVPSELDRNSVMQFIEDNKKALREYVKHPTNWKRVELQADFMNRFDKYQSITNLNPIVAKHEYSAEEKAIAGELVDKRLDKLFAFTEDLAKGKAKFTNVDLQNLVADIKSKENGYAHSSAEEASVAVSDYMAKAVKKGKNVGQAICDMRNKNEMSNWVSNNPKKFYGAVVADTLRYVDSTKKNVITFSPTFPPNSVNLSFSGSDDLSFAIPTKEGAIIQKDISKLVGTEAYLMYNVKDDNLAKAKNIVEFSNGLKKYESKISEIIYNDYVEKKYWLSRKEANNYLAEQKNLVEKPFGNKYHNCIFEKGMNKGDYNFLLDNFKVNRNLYDELTKSQQGLVAIGERYAKENNITDDNGNLYKFNRKGDNVREEMNSFVNHLKEHGFVIQPSNKKDIKVEKTQAHDDLEK